MARTLISIAFVWLALVSFVARAQSGGDEPVRLDLRFMASDLVDEMVHTWLRTSPFATSTPLVIAEIDGPIGLDERFEQEIENHLFELMRANPRLPVQLVHCSLCRQWVAYSQPKKTVIGKALNQPEVLEQFRQYPQTVALSLHFDVIVDDLVLWAEIYEIKAPQKVVWAQRFSHRTSARSVLQEPSKLVSLAEAREEQRRLLAGRDTLQAVTRFPIRNFGTKEDGGGGGAGAQTAPLIFLEQSLEAVLGPQRNRRAGLSIGLTSIKDTYQGWSFGAHFSQLLGRREPSLTQPDLYLRTGVVFLRLEGPGAAVFGENQIDIARLLDPTSEPKASLTAWQIGLEAHVKYRFGFSTFIEYVPLLESSNVIETRRFIVPFHSVGFAGVLFW